VDRALDVEQVASIFSVRPATVRLWIRDGRLPAFKVSNVRGGRKQWRVMVAVVKALQNPVRRPEPGSG